MAETAEVCGLCVPNIQSVLVKPLADGVEDIIEAELAREVVR
jgi:hypothetical protein